MDNTNRTSKSVHAEDLAANVAATYGLSKEQAYELASAVLFDARKQLREGNSVKLPWIGELHLNGDAATFEAAPVLFQNLIGENQNDG